MPYELQIKKEVFNLAIEKSGFLLSNGKKFSLNTKKPSKTQ